MSVEAAVIQFRKEFIPAFEQSASMLKMASIKEPVINGNQATFLVGGSGGDTAQTRGTNGNIPYGNPTNNQVTATLVEKHAAERITNFNVFASQGNQAKIMRDSVIGTINRDIDLTILAELDNATQDMGNGATASLSMVREAQAVLGYNDVDTSEQDDMFLVISPGFLSYISQSTEFGSIDYVDSKVNAGPLRKVMRWAGLTLIVTPRISGANTSSELCYMFHRKALGYAINSGEERIFAGFNEENGHSYARAEVYHGAKILQDSGIIKITHDGSAFVTT